MIFIADTNVLVRALVGDDQQQSALASAALQRAYVLRMQRSAEPCAP